MMAKDLVFPKAPELPKGHGVVAYPECDDGYSGRSGAWAGSSGDVPMLLLWDATRCSYDSAYPDVADLVYISLPVY